MTGFIHSIQSLGAVDGPGIRYVVFMQGCPLRCAYCHNPDTWEIGQATEMSSDRLTEQVLRYAPYFGDRGGVTVSGGEPLLQGEFVGHWFAQLHEHGIHTALDTSAHGTNSSIQAVLPHTDLVLCDLKFPTDKQYRDFTGGNLSCVLTFLEETAKRDIDVWIRHVVVPGYTDTKESLEKILALCKPYTNIKKIELLPFRKLCIDKYHSAGIDFPFENVPSCPAHTIETLSTLLPSEQSLKGVLG